MSVVKNCCTPTVEHGTWFIYLIKIIVVWGVCKSRKHNSGPARQRYLVYFSHVDRAAFQQEDRNKRKKELFASSVCVCVYLVCFAVRAWCEHGRLLAVNLRYIHQIHYILALICSHNCVSVRVSLMFCACQTADVSLQDQWLFVS